MFGKGYLGRKAKFWCLVKGKNNVAGMVLLLLGEMAREEEESLYTHSLPQVSRTDLELP